MDKTQKYLYWLDTADYDLNTARAMLNSGRYVYVAFLCQQALEKLAKGLYNYYIDDEVPRVHNISFILDKVLKAINISASEETYRVFDKLAAYYLEGRYPSFKENVSKLINKTEAKVILNQTEEVYQWMMTLKK